jgi:CDP-diacylglycerol--glycerol-3-phosphate 3-phosphatidyltransferase
MTISIYRLKSQFQKILQPLIVKLITLRITPNQLTASTMLLMLAYATILSWKFETAVIWAIFPMVLFLRMALNALDGMLAVQTNQTSAFGAILNEMCDVVSDTVLMIPFILLPGMYWPLWTSVVVLSILSEFAGLCAVAANAPRGFEGPMGKSDRAFMMAVMAILVVSEVSIAWLHGILGCMAILLAWTIFNRLHKAVVRAGLRLH